MDIAELIRSEETNHTDRATKENQIQEDFVWFIGPKALYQMTEAENETDPDKKSKKRFNSVVQ